jgi:KDO2-lipid IV(A) lauroyltransferase
MPAIGYSGYKMNQISALASVWKDESSSGIQKKSFDLKAGYEYTLPVQHIAVKSSLRPVFRALEKNEIVGITVDGGGGKKVVSVKFLDRNANFQQGAVDIAIRTGAAIVPAFIITEKDLKHKLIIHQPININQTLDKDENIRRILNEFIKILEGYVYQYPTHYGYTLYLRKSRVLQDPYPFFEDHLTINKTTHVIQ